MTYMDTISELVDICVQAMDTGSEHVFNILKHMVVHLVVQSTIFTSYKYAEYTIWLWSEATCTFQYTN